MFLRAKTFNNFFKKVVKIYSTNLKSIEFPYGITSIGSALSESRNIENIVLPDSLISIGDWAFYGFAWLTKIEIPDSVTSIGEYAFDTCPDFTTVYYTGTQAQWNALLENVGEGNDYLKNAIINFNYKGE